MKFKHLGKYEQAIDDVDLCKNMLVHTKKYDHFKSMRQFNFEGWLAYSRRESINQMFESDRGTIRNPNEWKYLFCYKNG